MANLAHHYKNELRSARQLANDGHFSYQLGCKLLQKLNKAELVKSAMGSKGGFTLNKEPSKITLMEIIKVLQDGIRLNKCLLNGKGCEFQDKCEISKKLACLQLYIEDYLGAITLEEILRSETKIRI